MSERLEAPTRCEMEGCSERAVAEINAQWSVADFVMYLACSSHVWEMYEGLSQRRVEGRVPHDVWVMWFDGSELQR